MSLEWLIEDLKIQSAICEMTGEKNKVDDLKKVTDLLAMYSDNSASTKSTTSSNKPITDRVKTFEDALAIVGASENVKILLSYNGLDKDMLSHKAHAKLTIIAKALNEGWIPDWKNHSEYKYYPYFEMNGKTGFVFGVSYYDFGDSTVGSRICFHTRELADYAGRNFLSEYRDFYT